MSYSDFLASLSSGVNLFYNTLVATADTLLSNYIVITILGLSIFVSLFYLFVNEILTLPFIFKKNKHDLDNIGGDK